MTSSPPLDPPRSGGRAPTFKRLPRAVREEQMLDAAVKVFSRRGYHAASMDEIAEDAGISKPMVYAYLGSKEQLFVACLHREGTRLMEAIVDAADVAAVPAADVDVAVATDVEGAAAADVEGAAAADGSESAPEPSGSAPEPGLERQLRRGLRAFFGFVGAHRDGWAMLYRQARGEPPFAGELAGMRARMVQVVAGLLGRGLVADRDESAYRDAPARPDEPAHREARRGPDEIELEVLAYALVGAVESLADWLVDHPQADPDRMADRVMQVLWLGTGQFLRGATRRP